MTTEKKIVQHPMGLIKHFESCVYLAGFDFAKDTIDKSNPGYDTGITLHANMLSKIAGRLSQTRDLMFYCPECDCENIFPALSDDIEIIQITSHTLTDQFDSGESYSYAEVLGLGKDGNVYEWNPYVHPGEKSGWVTHERLIVHKHEIGEKK